jgi:hypothetical protein
MNQRRPEGKSDAELAREVWARSSLKSLDAARALFLEYFGVEVTDPAIDEEFRKVLQDNDQSTCVIEIPFRLAVAIAIRSGGRPRGGKRKIAVARGAEALLVEMAERLWDEAGRKRGAAKRRAAEQAHAYYGKRAAISLETLLDRMGRKTRRPRAIRGS